MASERTWVYIKTFILLLAYIATTSAVYFYGYALLLESHALAIALAFVTVQLICIVTITSYLYMSKGMLAQQSTREQHMRAQIAEELAQYADGSDQMTTLMKFKQEDAHNLETTLATMLPQVRGLMRRRLVHLCSVLGYTNKWYQQCMSKDPRKRQQAIMSFGLLDHPNTETVLMKALKDESLTIRVEACRSLIRNGNVDVRVQAWRFAISQSLLVRALIAAELKPHALELCTNDLPHLLTSLSAQEIATTLEIVASWQRAVPLNNIDQLIRHADWRVRVAAIKVFPYALRNEQNLQIILASFADENAQVRAIAAKICSQIDAQEAMPWLLQCLNDTDQNVSYQAACALAVITNNPLYYSKTAVTKTA